MVVDAAMLVVGDEDGGVRPEIRVLANCGVDGGDELLSGANVVVGVLIAGDEFSGSVRSVVIGVVRLDEAVLGKPVAAARILEVLECAEELRLVLQKIDYLKRRTRLIEVVKPGGNACGCEAFVDALVFLVPVEDVQADLTE